MSEGTKLNSLVDSLEKLTRNPEFVKYTSDDLNSVKAHLNKINKSLHYHNEHQMNIGHFAFNQLFVNRILNMLEMSRDKAVILNSVEILLTLLESNPQVKKKFFSFYPSCTQVILKLVNQEFKGHEPLEEVFVALHKILAIIGPKDPKFAVKAKNYQTAKVTVNLFKRNMGSPENILPLLKVLKLCCAETSTVTMLSKTPVVSILLDVLNNFLKRNDKVVKLVLLTYVLLFRIKCCVDTFIGRGGVENFLDIIETWSRDDTKNKTLRTRSSLLLVLGHVVSFKSGMCAVQKLNGVYRLYCICCSLKATKKFESHSLLICNVMRNCLVANKLPVTSVASPYKVARPASRRQDPVPLFAYRPREIDSLLRAEPEECRASEEEEEEEEEAPEADDFGISTDHCTRGFFDPCSILNTNLGHPKKLMIEPNELKLKNLFSLVSIRDDTNTPFGTTPSKAVDFQKKVASSAPEARPERKTDSEVSTSKDGTCQTFGRDVRLFDASKTSEVSLKAGTVGKTTLSKTKQSELPSNDYSTEALEGDVEEEVMRPVEVVEDNFMSYESFFEELYLAEKLLSKHEFSFSNAETCEKSMIFPKGLVADFSLNCNKTSNNASNRRNDSSDTTSLSSGGSGRNRATADDPSPFVVIDGSGRRKESSGEISRTSSSSSDKNRNDRRRRSYCEVALNRSSSNKTFPTLTDRAYPPGCFASQPACFGSNRINSTSLEELRNCRSDIRGRRTPNAAASVDSRVSSEGSTDAAMEILQDFLSIKQEIPSGHELMTTKKKSSLSQQSFPSGVHERPEDRMPSKARKAGSKSSFESNLKAYKIQFERGTAGSPPSPLPKRLSPPRAALAQYKRSFKVKAANQRLRISDQHQEQNKDVQVMSESFYQEELQRRLADRCSKGGSTNPPLSTTSAYPCCRPPGPPKCSHRSSDPAVTKGQIASLAYDRLNRDVDRYLELASQTLSVVRFARVAYPDLYGHVLPLDEEHCTPYRRCDLLRSRILEDVRRELDPNDLINVAVYNIDENIALQSHAKSYNGDGPLSNDDEKCILNAFGDLKKGIKRSSHLNFDSQFEGGNLRKAIQVREYEYDLILMPDINTRGQHQWFYFRVTDMRSNVPYRFNIINCEKGNSQFNFGMQPVFFSVAEAVLGRPCWTRAGDEVCYYRNHLLKSPHLVNETRLSNLSFFYTATFSLTFKHSPDVCYLAYHYPYTYTGLMHYIDQLENTNNSQRSSDIRHRSAMSLADDDAIEAMTSQRLTNNNAGFSGRANRNSQSPSVTYLKTQTLCRTLGGNNVPLVTVTALPVLTGHLQTDLNTALSIRNRPYVFLTARVHPGESNSSWVMRGTLDYLLSECDNARQLREAFIFKIVPMLNPDGVVNGNHRCSLYGDDLNRQWLEPSLSKHSSIFHTKALMLFLQQSKSTAGIYAFCDYHGHSRKKNVFLYGCSPLESWMPDDRHNPTIRHDKVEDESYKLIPTILDKLAAGFQLQSCNFAVEKFKESTARVVIWRQVGVIKSYTMESSYCGFDQGPYKGLQINTYHLEEVGRQFLMAVGLSRDHSDDVTSLINTSDEPTRLKTTASKRRPREHSKSDSIESLELEEMMEELNDGLREQDSDDKVSTAGSKSG